MGSNVCLKSFRRFGVSFQKSKTPNEEPQVFVVSNQLRFSWIAFVVAIAFLDALVVWLVTLVVFLSYSYGLGHSKVGGSK